MKTNEFAGIWHIYEMSEWDKDYFNMEVQAFIKIEKSGRGKFQFGLVCGSMDGRIINHPDGKRFEFTWDGNDECDDASGSGWIMMKGANAIEGEIRIHDGDSSAFKAKRAVPSGKQKRRDSLPNSSNNLQNLNSR